MLHHIERRLDVNIEDSVLRLGQLPVLRKRIGEVVPFLGYTGIGDDDVHMTDLVEDGSESGPGGYIAGVVCYGVRRVGGWGRRRAVEDMHCCAAGAEEMGCCEANSRGATFEWKSVNGAPG